MTRVAIIAAIAGTMLAQTPAQYEAALRAADAALKSQPANAQLWMRRGAALYGLGRAKESLASYRKAIQLAPGLMPALKAAAQLEYSGKDPNARKTLNRIVAIEPANEVAHGMLAVLDFEAKNCAGAVTHFAKAGNLIAGQKTPLWQQGYCLWQLGRHREAIAAFEKALALDGSDDRTRIHLVFALEAAGEPARAIEVLKPLAAAATPSADVLGLLAELYRANRQIEPAVETFRRAIALYPKEERLYIGLVALCLYYYSSDAGFEILGLGMRNIPNSARLYAMRGVLYSQVGEREKSMADFERAAELSPREGMGQAGLALSLLQTDRIDEAIELLRSQVKQNPGDANAYHLLAQALLRKGAQPGDALFAEAQAALEKSVRIEPRLQQAHALLGKLYLQLDRKPAAIRELEAALRIEPDSRAAIYQLMLAYEASGRTKEATAMRDRLRASIEKERQEEAERNKTRLLKAQPEASASR